MTRPFVPTSAARANIITRERVRRSKAECDRLRQARLDASPEDRPALDEQLDDELGRLSEMLR